jgi:hypothetical protein
MGKNFKSFWHKTKSDSQHMYNSIRGTTNYVPLCQFLIERLINWKINEWTHNFEHMIWPHILKYISFNLFYSFIAIDWFLMLFLYGMVTFLHFFTGELLLLMMNLVGLVRKQLLNWSDKVRKIHKDKCNGNRRGKIWC